MQLCTVDNMQLLNFKNVELSVTLSQNSCILYEKLKTCTNKC